MMLYTIKSRLICSICPLITIMSGLASEEFCCSHFPEKPGVAVLKSLFEFSLRRTLVVCIRIKNQEAKA